MMRGAVIPAAQLMSLRGKADIASAVELEAVQRSSRSTVYQLYLETASEEL